MKPKFYGRRILKWELPNGKVQYTLSGQWVGHSYGSDTGTTRQRNNAAPSKEAKLVGMSQKIFWGMTGNAGQKITPPANTLFIKA